MAMTKDQKEFVKMLNNPEVKKALGLEKDEKLQALMTDLEITDDDTLESLAKKSNAKMKEVVSYMTDLVANVKEDTAKQSSEDADQAEKDKIAKFSADHPGMKNTKVVALMQQLYDKGTPLQEAYDSALEDLNIEPEQIQEDGTVKAKEEAKSKEAKASKKEAKGAKSSVKSDLSGEDDDVDEEEEDDESKAPLSLDEALASASNAYIAKNGDPFAEKD